MTKQLEFFFDYVSPTTHLAFPVAGQVAERTGAEIVYRPMFLGGVMQATGNRPPGMVAAKGKYMGQDMQRCAKRIGIELYMNPHFPMNTRGLTRATIGLLESDPAEALRFMKACLKHCWGKPDPMDPGKPEEVAAMCEAEGFDAETISALASDDANKDKLRTNTEEAVERGVFGAPSFFVGEELFFGHDRLDYAEEALS